MTPAVFLGVLALYLWRLPPALAPWRDSGELSLAATTLGVPHPTSYPLYVLLGRLAAAVPLGNAAYRLNLLSAAAGAAACAVLFAALKARRGAAPALACALALAFNGSFWAAAQVSEMYSLWILLVVGLVALAERLSADATERLWPAFVFCAALSLGNRLDLVLLAPGLLWLALAHRPLADGEDARWAGVALLLAPAASALTGSNLPAAAVIAWTLWSRTRGPGSWDRLAKAALWGLAGFSVYLFLPVRSAGGPFLDWNHPAAARNLLDSILRTRYGGTLDLVSRNYATGELFGVNVRLWAVHLGKVLGPLLPFALWGALRDAREDRVRFLGRLAAWCWAGPVFLFLANMPPNAHALAVLDPHYMLSDVLALFWAAGGLAAAAERLGAASPALALLPAAWALALGVPSALDRRERFESLDFATSVFRAAPPGAVVVAKKDVQLYALWHWQTVAGRRPDLAVVAQGLSASPWYRADWDRRDRSLPVSNLFVPEGWAALAAGGRPVLFTHDAEPPPAVGASAAARGDLSAVSGAGSADIGPFLVRRGVRRAEDAPDFFTKDLVESRAVAFLREGVALQKAGRPAEAERAFLSAWACDWDFPDAALYLGFLYATTARMKEAADVYEAADRLFTEKTAEAVRVRSTPELVSAVRRQAAEAATHRGVAAEKLGDRAAAEAHYRRALSLYPLAQTRFDLAVLAWGKDWAAVEEHLAEAVRLDPTHAEARKYLEALKRRPR